jgi:CRISPR-associated protein Cst2
MKNLKAQGFILIDVDVVALNNAGKDTRTTNENAIITKKIYKGGKSYVYVSGQAWRYWWRDALQKMFAWKMSPVIREDKIAFTAANPLIYDDDDVFGYMKAAKEEVQQDDEETKEKRTKKGKTKSINVTVTRVSPLRNSVLVSVGAVQPVENWSSMARQEGDSVPYVKQEYSAIMKGMFSLDLEQIGTFSSYNKTGFKNLTGELRGEALKNGAVEIDDPFVLDKEGKPCKLIRLSSEVRVKRAVETILALKNISGGAMQTSNMGDVTPKFVVLATLNSGNHPFSHIVSAKGKDVNIVELSVEALREVLKDYRDNIRGKVFIGRRAGFLDETAAAIDDLKKELPDMLEVCSVNEAIDRYAQQVREQL